MISGPNWLAFLAFAAPGLIFELLRERHIPRTEESAFREISAVTLASLACTSAAIAVLALVRAVKPQFVADPRLLLTNWHAYLTGSHRLRWHAHYRLVAGSAAAEIALAATAAYAMYRLGPRRWRQGRSIPQDAMYAAFRMAADADVVPYVRLVTESGVGYEGKVAAYDTSGSLGDRVFALEAPVRRYADATSPPTTVAKPWYRVVVPQSRIAEIHVAYAPAPERGTFASTRRRLRGLGRWLQSSAP